jgi:hypothetical protein
MLLDMLDNAEKERDEYKAYVEAFYEANGRAGILGEKLHTDHSVEITFGIGVGLGGAIFGLSPYLFDKDNFIGIVAIIMGIALMVGASIARAVKR